MKKVFSCVFALLLCICVLFCTACGEAQTATKTYDIIATVFPAYDFARAVAGDVLNIKMLLPPGGEAHGFSPTLDDLASVQSCSLFIYTGGATDAWATEQFRSGNLDTEKFTAFAMTEHVDTLPVPDAVEQHDHEHESESHEEDADEHVWTSPANAIKLLEDICTELCVLFPAHTDTFKANTAAYVAEIRQQEAEMQTIVDSAKNKMLVFEDRFPFAYFCEQFGLAHTAAFGSCAGNTEVSAATLNTLVTTIKENNIPCILHLEFSKLTTAERIARETGCKILQLHSYHNVTQEDFDNGVTYVDLMKRNITTLKEALF